MEGEPLSEGEPPFGELLEYSPDESPVALPDDSTTEPWDDLSGDLPDCLLDPSADFPLSPEDDDSPWLGLLDGEDPTDGASPCDSGIGFVPAEDFDEAALSDPEPASEGSFPRGDD